MSVIAPSRLIMTCTSGIIWLDYSPASIFWVDKEIIGNNDSDFITLTYKDNESLPDSIVKEIEKAKEKATTSSYWVTGGVSMDSVRLETSKELVYRIGKR